MKESINIFYSKPIMPLGDKPTYQFFIDWIQDGNIHTKLFQGETYTTVFDQAYDFATYISESVGIPMSDISIIGDNSYEALS